MDLSKIPLFSMLNDRMAWLGQRQEVLAHNIANADTPGFVPSDLVPVDFAKLAQAEVRHIDVTATDAGHLVGASRPTTFRQTEQTGAYETTPSGNAVVLEEQLMKVSQNGDGPPHHREPLFQAPRHDPDGAGTLRLTAARRRRPNGRIIWTWSRHCRSRPPGLKVQGERLRVIGENIANANSTALGEGGEPYRRKTITFENALDRELGIDTVRVARFGVDSGALGRRHDPNHPAAGADGYVLLPNVNPLIEMADMREAMRSYEANLSVVRGIEVDASENHRVARPLSNPTTPPCRRSRATHQGPGSRA